jgi:TatA/E family protein of Tat protein translocase
MFGLGMGELLVILVLALLFLGPKKLPEVASSLGKAIRSFRKATTDLTDSLEVDESVKQPLRELKAALRDEPAPHVLAVQKPLENTVNTKPLEKLLEKSAPAESPAPPAEKPKA